MSGTRCLRRKCAIPIAFFPSFLRLSPTRHESTVCCSLFFMASHGMEIDIKMIMSVTVFPHAPASFYLIAIYVSCSKR